MLFLKLVFLNIFRAKLRSLLTIFGLIVAIVAFGLLQTVVNAWFAGSDAASSSRLIARNSISLVFSMPISYKDKIRGVEGVKAVSYSNWFGGVYREPKNFFPQFAVDHETYFDLYPEYIFKPDELAAFKRDRQGAAVGRKLAETHGWKIGDVIPIRGTIYQGDWRFTLRAIFDGKEEGTITRQMYFHYDYLNETVKKIAPRRGDSVGIFLVDIKDPTRAAEISRAVDDTFKNSLAETLTETEKAFQLSFVAQSEAIVLAIRVVSFVVIFIIMTVVANTMAMTARERISEYATLKALGYTPLFVGLLVFSEAMLLALFGAGIGILLTFPVASVFGVAVSSVFPVFRVSSDTLYLQLICACVVGVVAAIVPGIRSANIKIVDGLRHRG